MNTDYITSLRETANDLYEAHGAGPDYDRGIRENASNVIYMANRERWSEMAWACAKLDACVMLRADRDRVITWDDIAERAAAKADAMGVTS
jgi:hypothetical protein